MDTDRRQDGTEAETEEQLRLPPGTLLAIRGLARLEGMTADVNRLQSGPRIGAE